MYPKINLKPICLFQVARLSSFVGAMAIGDLVKSTLGPKGMDKILWGMGRNEGVVEVGLVDWLSNSNTELCYNT